MSANGRRVMAIWAAGRVAEFPDISASPESAVLLQTTSRAPDVCRSSAFTLTTLCDNAHFVKHTAGFIGYADLPFGFVGQIGDDIPGQIGAHGQSCVFSRRCVGQHDRKIRRRQSAVPNTE